MFRLIFNKGVPSNILPPEAITVEGQKVIIDLSQNTIFKDEVKVWIPPIPSTGSMKPSFGAGNNNILIAPTTPEDQRRLAQWLWAETLRGKDNVAVYRNPAMYAIHRCIKTGYDRAGRWFKFRGDNNISSDHWKIRDHEIKWLSIGSIY